MRVIEPAQIRMARAALQWSLDDAGERCGLNRNLLSRIERGKADPSVGMLSQIRAAFEAEGVTFIWDGGRTGLLFCPKS